MVVHPRVCLFHLLLVGGKRALWLLFVRQTVLEIDKNLHLLIEHSFLVLRVPRSHGERVARVVRLEAAAEDVCRGGAIAVRPSMGLLGTIHRLSHRVVGEQLRMALHQLLTVVHISPAICIVNACRLGIGISFS